MNSCFFSPAILLDTGYQLFGSVLIFFGQRSASHFAGSLAVLYYTMPSPTPPWKLDGGYRKRFCILGASMTNGTNLMFASEDMVGVWEWDGCMGTPCTLAIKLRSSKPAKIRLFTHVLSMPHPSVLSLNLDVN